MLTWKYSASGSRWQHFQYIMETSISIHELAVYLEHLFLIAHTFQSVSIWNPFDTRRKLSLFLFCRFSLYVLCHPQRWRMYFRVFTIAWICKSSLAFLTVCSTLLTSTIYFLTSSCTHFSLWSLMPAIQGI